MNDAVLYVIDAPLSFDVIEKHELLSMFKSDS